MVKWGGRGELRLLGARCRVKKVGPVVLENKLGGSGRAGFPEAHPAALRQRLEFCHALHWEQRECLGPMSTPNAGAFSVTRVSCHSSALQINASQMGQPHQIPDRPKKVEVGTLPSSAEMFGLYPNLVTTMSLPRRLLQSQQTTR